MAVVPVFGEGPERQGEDAAIDPLLEPTMAGLGSRIVVGQVRPACPRLQDSQHAIEYGSC